MEPTCDKTTYMWLGQSLAPAVVVVLMMMKAQAESSCLQMTKKACKFDHLYWWSPYRTSLQQAWQAAAAADKVLNIFFKRWLRTSETAAASLTVWHDHLIISSCSQLSVVACCKTASPGGAGTFDGVRAAAGLGIVFFSKH